MVDPEVLVFIAGFICGLCAGWVLDRLLQWLVDRNARNGRSDDS